jgi:hypothetical protein
MRVRMRRERNMKIKMKIVNTENTTEASHGK